MIDDVIVVFNRKSVGKGVWKDFFVRLIFVVRYILIVCFGIYFV